MKKRIVAITLILCLLAFCGCKENATTKTGTVSFTVVDGLNSTPIENVKIVLPENNATLNSDINGKTEECTVTIQEDNRFSLSQGYGTFTVLAFKEGYCDYALFYAKIKPDENRKMKIFLFREDTPISNGAPIAIIESPDENWTKEYIKIYK